MDWIKSILSYPLGAFQGKSTSFTCYRDLDYSKPIGAQRYSGHSRLDDLLRPLVYCNDLPKNCLDLYLPNESIATTGAPVPLEGKRAFSPPSVVVFVHGGGWRRGHTTAWKHFLSSYDINLLMAVIFWFTGLYDNVGQTFARRGYACVVISYPLSNIPFPLCLLEQFTSFVMTNLSIYLFILPFLLVFPIHQVENTYVGLLSIGHAWDLICSCFILSVWFTLAFRWAVTMYFWYSNQSRPHFCQPTAKIAFIPPVLLFYFLLNYYLNLPTQTQLTVCISVIIWVEVAVTKGYLRIKSSPHPKHIESVAKAVSWTEALGRSSGLFNHRSMYMVGHSAGGHLVSLLALDHQYLLQAGVDATCIKAVLSISGVYDLLCFSGRPWNHLYLYPVFSTQPDTWLKASPLHILKTQSASLPEYIPPFFVCYAERDMRFFDTQAIEFTTLLRKKKVVAELMMVGGTHHLSIITQFQYKNTAEECIRFISEHSD